MKRRLILAVVLTLTAALLLLSCGDKGGGKGEVSGASPFEIIEKLASGEDVRPGIIVSNENAEESADMLEITYGDSFDEDMFHSYAFYPPLMNISSSEFGVFKLADTVKMNEAKAMVEGRIADVRRIFEQYLPDQYAIALGAEIRTFGDYLVYAMTSDNEAVFDTVKEMIEQP